ncbi:MAG TPA: DNA primase [Candidatus Paceibacterota bacterium]
MATDTVQQIKDKLSIVDVVSQYVKLERAGTSMRARCPFHAERTPSFHVSPERGTYHCFGCNVGGDIFSFVETIEGLDFKGALKVLAEKAGVPLVYSKGKSKDDDALGRLFELLEAATIFYTSRITDDAKKYLRSRGVEEETMQAFRIGWASDAWSECADYLRAKKYTEREILDAGLAKKNERGGLTDKFRNRIMFPIADSAGRIVGFSGRIFPSTSSGQVASSESGFTPPKYMNSPETPLYHKSRILYGYDRAKQAIRKHNFSVLVEGQMDLIASHQAGWSNTVAVSGTAFTPEHASMLKRMSENLVLALDADQAGIKAAGRAARAALQGGLNVKVARLPSGSDPADLIQKQGVDVWRAAIRDSKDIITFLLDVLEEHAKGADGFRRSVEIVVLPFLVDVASPIAREQYVREIAERLKVSERAVSEALANVPRVPGEQIGEVARTKSEKPEGSNRIKPSVVPERVRQAYAILLWQRAHPRSSLDLDAYESELIQMIGKDSFATLETLSRLEKESLRFSAEMLHGKARSLAAEVRVLLDAIALEHLRDELAQIAAALKVAEDKQDAKEIERLTAESKLLTGRIAKHPSSV